MNHEHHYHAVGNAYELILLLSFILLEIIYIFAVFRSRWPFYRTAFWVLGVLCIAVVSAGPMANGAQPDFKVHMIGHLLLGMVAPLLIHLSAPVTLVLRTLHVKRARLVSGILKSTPIRILHDPIATSILNVGGLWVLYTTDLYAAMHQNLFLYFIIHFHVFTAGYLFTASMINIEPTPHRPNFIYRSIVLVIALAGHGILSKYIYVHPPSGVPTEQAELGAMIMYYGGDVLDSILIYILCLQWYKFKKPKTIGLRQAGEVVNE